jgi:hypothetical protein
MNHHQFAMTAEDNINSGHGPGACPGRLLAGAEVKIILCEILRRFDVDFGPNGESEGIDGQVCTFYRILPRQYLAHYSPVVVPKVNARFIQNDQSMLSTLLFNISISFVKFVRQVQRPD